MQLLQARGWYGVFLRTVSDEPVENIELGVREVVRLSVRLRPLVGWSSAEGGFRGLYYNEQSNRLTTEAAVLQEQLLGDICEDETTTIRAILIKNVLDRADSLYNGLMINKGVLLDESAVELLLHHRLPKPRRINEGHSE